MMLLVSGATRTVYQYDSNPYIGVLMVPGAGNDLDKIPASMKIAADNGAFKGLNAPSFVRMLERLKDRQILWVTCPDTVGNCIETRRKFNIWSPLIRDYRLPVAYVLQDGEQLHRIPWDEIACLFIGGTTEYKLGEETREIVKYAKKLGKWVHMGRVNSVERIRYAQSIQCDSVDGTSFSMFSEATIPHALTALRYEQTWLGVSR